MATVGPKTRRRKKFTLVRFWFWVANVPLVLALITWTSEEIVLYHLAVITVLTAALTEWAAYSADSPTDE